MAATTGVPDPASKDPKETKASGDTSSADQRGFDKLVEKEAQLTEKDQKLTQREKEIKAKEARLERIPVEDLSKAVAAGDPVAALKAMGLDPEAAMRKIAAGIQPPKEPTPEEKLAKQLAEAQQTAAQALTEAQQAKADRQIEKQLTFIEGLIESGGDRYELLAQEGPEGASLVLKTLLANIQNGEDLTHESACDMIEALLRQKADKQAQTKYVKAKLGVPASSSEDALKDPKTAGKPPPATITNKTSSSPADTGAALPTDPDARWKEIVRRRGLAQK